MDAPTAELDRIHQLETQQQSVTGSDPIAEAGRKVLLRQLVAMLRHEAGSRTGEDIEDVHDMRVATRRMRSTLRLLEPYYKPKRVRGYNRTLRKIAAALGAVRDMDVLIEDVTHYGEGLADEERAHLQPIVQALSERRDDARAALNRFLDKGEYTRFVDEYAKFLTTPGAGVPKADDDDEGAMPAPTTVRHLLPTMIYQHLGQVRAYDGVLEEADETTLHALRIEFKRLRYAVQMFSEVLGAQVNDYVDEIKAVQDHLGRMQDIVVARATLTQLLHDLPPESGEALSGYLSALDDEAAAKRRQVDEVWRQFNKKPVQKQLATAISWL